MTNQIAVFPSIRRSVGRWIMAGALTLAITVPMTALPSFADSCRLQQLIPLLGLTTDERAVGTVAYLALSFEERSDRSGLIVHFQNGPGRFSRMAQTSTEQEICRAARPLWLPTDSWSVALAVPYAGTTIYGESLSAMVGVSVAAMAMGHTIAPGVVLTGTITPEGSIGSVGGVLLKVAAAGQAHMRQVLVPDQANLADVDWSTPLRR